MLPAYIKCKFHHTGIGAFWIRKWVFDTIGGFSEKKDVLEDIEFAMRLKKFCNKMWLKYKNLESPLYWSTRKFDELGDWYWAKHLWSYLKAIYTTKCNKNIQVWWGEISRNIFRA